MGQAFPTPLARLALIVGVLAACTALLAGPAYRWLGLGLGTSLAAMRWAAIGGVVGALLAAVAIAARGRLALRRPVALVLAALLLNLAVATPLLLMYRKAQTLPHIHDVTTDTVDPPVFVAVQTLRAGARNPTDYDARTAVLQQRGYPDIVPLHVALPPDQAYVRAQVIVRALGWAVAAADEHERRIEATDTTLLFGFKDDVVIRIRPEASGSRIDMRSLSRVGGSDFGVNAGRVRNFLHRMAEAAADRP